MSHRDPVVRARYLRMQMQLRYERFANGEVEVVHGTMAAYNSYKCRCDECIHARRVYDALRRGGDPTRRRALSDEVRERAIPIAVESGAAEAARQAEVSTTTVYKWLRAAGLKAGRAPRLLKRDVHGTEASYAAGCRCLPCREANRERCYAVLRSLRERAASGLIKVPHGAGGYRNYGCRCEVCTKANTDMCRPAARRWAERNRRVAS